MSTTRRTFLTGSFALVAAPLAAEAQRHGTARIGFLRVGPPPAAWIEDFRQGLRQSGYVEGQNIVIDFGLAQQATQLPEKAAELISRKAGVFFAPGSPSVVPAR